MPEPATPRGAARRPPSRRTALTGLGAVVLGAAATRRATAQDPVPPLRPGEAIGLGDIAVTVLGLTVRRSEQGSLVTLRLRVMAHGGQNALFSTNEVRLLAAGVPRAPRFDVGSFMNIAPESAMDFNCEFRIPDRAEDLVLQLRWRGLVERRRLPDAAR
jgi:hypothetical protein